MAEQAQVTTSTVTQDREKLARQLLYAELPELIGITTYGRMLLDAAERAILTALSLNSQLRGDRWEFDRFVDGVEMAEGIAITNAATLEEALQKATRLCPPGRNTVLVLTSMRQPSLNREGPSICLDDMDEVLLANIRPHLIRFLTSHGVDKVDWHAHESATKEIAASVQAVASLNRVSIADETTDCERCAGNGEIVTNWGRYVEPNSNDIGDEGVAACPDCDGTGKVAALSSTPTPIAGEDTDNAR